MTLGHSPTRTSLRIRRKSASYTIWMAVGSANHIWVFLNMSVFLARSVLSGSELLTKASAAERGVDREGIKGCQSLPHTQPGMRWWLTLQSHKTHVQRHAELEDHDLFFLHSVMHLLPPVVDGQHIEAKESLVV